MKKVKYEKPSITGFIDWVLHGDVSTGTLVRTSLWLILYAFVNLFVIFVCLPFYILRDMKRKDERVRGGEKKG